MSIDFAIDTGVILNKLDGDLSVYECAKSVTSLDSQSSPRTESIGCIKVNLHLICQQSTKRDVYVDMRDEPRADTIERPSEVQ